MANLNPRIDHLGQYRDKGLGTVQGEAAIGVRLPQDVRAVLKKVNQGLKKRKLSQGDYLRSIIYKGLKADGIYPDAQGDFDQAKLDILIEKFKVKKFKVKKQESLYGS